MMCRDTLVLVFFSDLHDSEHKAELFELNILVERHGKMHPYVKKVGCKYRMLETKCIGDKL